jgi:hypothetical protein
LEKLATPAAYPTMPTIGQFSYEHYHQHPHFNLLSIIWIATVFSLAKSACSSAGVFATFDENDMNMI